ncbi:MAG TPA: hypothetical protein VHW09_27225 [Bryobacteraceae bacterium]|nr:hypothetical protein [Bryobacteraceae bacterium]
MPTLTNEIIEAAITGFEAQKLKIDAQIAELRAMLKGEPAAPAAHAKTAKPKRKVSAAALKRMREGQQRRWAKVRGETAPAAKTAPAPKAVKGAKKKRKLSAAGKANIVAALKKRWAAKKKSGSARRKRGTTTAMGGEVSGG